MKRNIFIEDNASKYPAMEVLEKLGYKVIHPDAIPSIKRGESIKK